MSLTLWLGTDLWASPSSPAIIVAMTQEGPDEYEESPKGLRMPAAPIALTIDFSALSITSERIPMVLSYELWNEAGEAIVASYSNDYEMVTFMASQSGCFQLRLVTAESVYIGYIEL